ncbi:MAG: DUF2190 family protein [Ignavibacteriales bacterium]|nr:MAG: DUF2190 family protein [Ignavibacteriales bacterium]
MLTEQPILIASIQAAANLAKNLFIGFDGDICGNGVKALGVCNAETDELEQAPVMSKGIALVTTGDTVTVGDKVQSNAEGKAVTFASGEANGFAMDTSSGADELIRILLV